jgi:hypothetical protein
MPLNENTAPISTAPVNSASNPLPNTTIPITPTAPPADSKKSNYKVS